MTKEDNEKESRKKLIRTAVFCRETGELQIKDCLKTAPLDNGFTENLVTRQNVSREKDRIRIGDRGTLSHSLLLYTLLIIERNVL